MAQTNAPNEDALKKAVKDAIVETLQERRELIHEIFAEVLEESALVEAIRQGRKSKTVARDEVLSVLKDKT